METQIRVRKGDTCIVVCNNAMYYAIALEDLIAKKGTKNDRYIYPEIFRFIYVACTSRENAWNWTYSAFKNRTGYDKIYSNHIIGSFIQYRVLPYPMNLIPKEIQKSITEFKTKFKL